MGRRTQITKILYTSISHIYAYIAVDYCCEPQHMNATLKLYNTDDVAPIQYERIEACPRCNTHYHIKIEDAWTGPHTLQRAFCDCGHQITEQKCINLVIETVRIFQQ